MKRFLLFALCIIFASCGHKRVAGSDKYTVTEISRGEYEKLSTTADSLPILKETEFYKETKEQLTIHTACGDIVLINNNLTESDYYTSWEYLGYNQSFDLHFFNISQYETGRAYVLGDKSGQQAEVWDQPVINPHAPLFIAWSDRLPMADEPNGIQVWKVIDGGRIEQFCQYDMDKGMPGHVKWVDPGTLIFTSRSIEDDAIITYYSMSLNSAMLNDESGYTQGNELIPFTGLAKRFSQADLDYINDMPLGMGLANPKEYSFTLVQDTVFQAGIRIADIEDQKWVMPLINKPDYRIFHMPVINDCGKYWEVAVNPETTMYVLKSEVDFETWPDFLLRTLSLTVSRGTQAAFYNEQNESSAKTMFTDDKAFEVEAVDGNWIRVKESGEAFEKSDDEQQVGDSPNSVQPLTPKTYWTKWNDGKKLLIRPILLM